MEPKRAEDEAEDRKEEEDVDEVGDEDKATVDVVKPLAEAEERDGGAEAAGQDLSSSVTSFILHIDQPSRRCCVLSCFQSVPACTPPERPSPRPHPPKVGPPITALHCSSLTSRGTLTFKVVFYFITLRNVYKNTAEDSQKWREKSICPLVAGCNIGPYR